MNSRSEKSKKQIKQYKISPIIGAVITPLSTIIGYFMGRRVCNRLRFEGAMIGTLIGFLVSAIGYSTAYDRNETDTQKFIDENKQYLLWITRLSLLV